LGLNQSGVVPNLSAPPSHTGEELCEWPIDQARESRDGRCDGKGQPAKSCAEIAAPPGLKRCPEQSGVHRRGRTTWNVQLSMGAWCWWKAARGR